MDEFEQNQGGSKYGRRTLKIFWEDWYAREISRFVCNKVRLFNLDDSGNCIIRKTWLHCIWFEKKYRLMKSFRIAREALIAVFVCRILMNSMHACEYSLMNKSINKVLAGL